MKTTLVLRHYGTSLGKSHKKFVVKRGGEKIGEYPVESVELISVEGKRGKFLSSDAIALALEHRVFIIFATKNGKPYGIIMPPTMTGSVQVRRYQFLAYFDPRGVHLAKSFALGKVTNQQRLLKLWAKNRKKESPKLAEELFDSAESMNSIIDKLRKYKADRVSSSVQQDIRNLEAEAARVYWSSVAKVLHPEWEFKGRVTKGAKDKFNILLNYGYQAILFPEVFRAVVYAGLDPFAGYLHADRPGKPSLVLDLMEEFRQYIVDKNIMTLILRGMLKPDEVLDESNYLTDRAIRIIREKISENINTAKITIRGVTTTLKNAMLYQGRALARYLRGDEPEYHPLKFPW